MEYSMTTQFMMELIGTLVLVLFGDGVCACVTLNKSKGQNAGWIVITIAWGLAVCMGVLVAGPYTGAHLNPAVSIGLAVAGLFPWASVPAYCAAQMIGGFLGGLLVYLFYKNHYDAHEDEAAKLGTFCTAPAIRNTPMNLLSEIIATIMLVIIIISFGVKGNTYNPDTHAFGLAALGPIPVTLLIIALGMSLGGTTGYAMNPARDLSPRIAHAVCMKGSNDWGYSWVPVIGPIIGGVIAGFLGIYLRAL
ncbi:MAG: aquaporin family protein [Prevotella bivia]|uniref:MIP/aquaporin family protein n=1 Tax=uncultured Prevotella sp. TaxID=159272 RepID=UPI0028060878|nr:MIP/aquaporin family protein [uncultured Prevotella sp.]MBS6328633.1 aquaporin family protein [Prevotella bivia]